MSALVYDYMSSTYINTHSDINHKVYGKLFTANPGVIYTRLCGLQRPPHFDLSLIYSVTYRRLNMQSYVQVSSFSPSAPQTDVKKLLCARKCRFGKSTQWFKGVFLETPISENRCYQGKGAPDSAGQSESSCTLDPLTSSHRLFLCEECLCVFFYCFLPNQEACSPLETSRCFCQSMLTCPWYFFMNYTTAWCGFTDRTAHKHRQSSTCLPPN